MSSFDDPISEQLARSMQTEARTVDLKYLALSSSSKAGVFSIIRKVLSIRATDYTVRVRMSRFPYRNIGFARLEKMYRELF